MPKQPDLSKFSLDDLKQLRKNVDKEIADYEKKKRQEALKAVQAVAKEHGLSLDELVGKSSRSRGATTPPKYRNPDNPEQTWSGRGRQPGWFKSRIEAGAKPKSMEI